MRSFIVIFCTNFLLLQLSAAFAMENSGSDAYRKAEDVYFVESELFPNAMRELKRLLQLTGFDHLDYISAFPVTFQGASCEGRWLRGVPTDFLYELSSMRFQPHDLTIQPDDPSYMYIAVQENLNKILANQQNNTRAFHLISGSFNSCDKVQVKENKDKFRISIGGGSGFSLGGFMGSDVTSLKRECISVRMTGFVGLLKPTTPEGMVRQCIYFEDTRSGRDTNVGIAGLFYDKGEYIVRGIGNDRAKTMLIYSSYITLLAQKLKVPVHVFIPQLYWRYSDRQLRQYVEHFKHFESNVQMAIIQSLLTTWYQVDVDDINYGHGMSAEEFEHLDSLESQLSAQNASYIYGRLLSELLKNRNQQNVVKGAAISSSGRQEKAVMERIAVTYKATELGKRQSYYFPNGLKRTLRCKQLRKCRFAFAGKVDETMLNYVEIAYLDAFPANSRVDVECTKSSRNKLACSIEGTRENLAEFSSRKFERNLYGR